MLVKHTTPVGPENTDHAHRITKLAEVARWSIDSGNRNVGDREACMGGFDDEIGFVFISVTFRMHFFDDDSAKSAKPGLTVTHCAA